MQNEQQKKKPPGQSTKNSMYDDNEMSRGDSTGNIRRMRSSVNSRPGRRLSSAAAVSSWVLFMDREVGGYTAGLAKSRWGFLSGILITLMMSIVYVIFYTRIETTVLGQNFGRGHKFFSLFITNVDPVYETISLVSTVCLWLFIYLFDVDLWEKDFETAGKFVFLLASLMTLASLLFLSESILFAPYFAYILVFISILATVKYTFFPDVHKLIYIQSIILGAVFSAGAIFFIFLYALANGGTYEGQLEVVYHDLLDCPELEDPDYSFENLINNDTRFEEFEELELSLIECEEALLVWASPMIYVCGAVSLSGVLWILYRAERRRIATRQRVGLEPIEQAFVYFLAISSIALWFAISLANATTVIDGTIFSIVGLIYFTIFITTVSVFRWKYIKSQFRNSPVGERVISFFQSDWGRATILLAGAPLLVFFLILDFIKQLVRKTLTKSHFALRYRQTIFTRKVSKRLMSAARWDFGSVIPKAHLLSLIAFFLLVGVSKFVILFFSSVRTEALNNSFAAAVFTIIPIGLALHLAPLARSPVVPIYILLGIAIPSSAEQAGNMSYFSSLLFAIFLGVFIRELSRMIQYWIGVRFGMKRLRLKRICKINSPEMKGVHLLFSQKGNLKQKMIILSAAPDFVTGVFMGMKGHSLFWTMVWSFPAVFRITPSVFLGAIFVKAGEEPENRLFSLLTVLIIILVIVCLSVPGVQQTLIKKRAAETYKAIIENQEVDEELAELEAKSKAITEKFIEITSWPRMSLLFKILHIWSLLVISFGLYLFNIFEENLFVVFDVTDDIGETLDGNGLKIIKTEGWYVFGAFLVAVFYMVLYKKVNRRIAKNMLNEENNTKVKNTTVQNNENGEETLVEYSV